MRRILSPHAYSDAPIADCFWADSVPLPDCAPLAGDKVADVAIIGAGFTGLSAAFRLAEAGRDVVVLDAKQPGWGASGRNGGFCCIGGSKASDTALTARVGSEGCRDYRLAERDAVLFVSDLIDRLGLDVDRHSKGETLLAHRRRDFEAMKREAAGVETLYGVAPELIEARDLPAHGMAGSFHGAMTTPIGFALNPRKYLVGLLTAAQNAGACVHGNTGVTSVTRTGASFALLTEHGTVTAGQVIVATNGYSAEDIPNWMSARVLPAQSSVLVTRPITPAEQEQQGWTSQQMAYDSRRLLHYFRLMPDGRFLFGMRGGIRTNASADHRAHARTRADFERMFPAWRHIGAPWHWSGFVALSRDLTPFAASVPDQPGLHAAFAYHGNGVAMGSYSGALVADTVLGRSELRYPEVMKAPPGRFPFGSLRRVALAPAYLAYGLADL
ncbi:NAD(P)/FAD-dependent oxidoreductase [Shimia biformata]|uniref:NAD(P)/FAD-dependent oxidoreductase n=1 Tax=Shimia biformata TaxID=1294299 RepID=UPI0019511731|nr:FAD-binding oxidoreductase [Shimia biformata]